ncbi:MAG TPA: pirin family protein [Polyangiales bacterium]|nr:pirin family protein [Polyangiales bacterium]
MEMLQISSFSQPELYALEVVSLEQLLQVTPIGGRGFAHHRLPFMPASMPGRLEFGCIKLFATETIAAGDGYPMHEHRNGEIITLVLEGIVSHQNTLGPNALIPADTVAVTSAGRGVRHAEFADASGPCRIVQIVLETRSLDREPRAEEAIIPRTERRGRFRVLASGRVCDLGSGALYIDQDAALSSCVFDAGMSREYAVERGRIAYMMPVDAPIRVDGRTVDANERVLVRRSCTLEITATAETEVLVLNMSG